MKTLYPFFIIALFALGMGCEEIVFENTIDTVYITRQGENTLVPTFITVVDTIVIRDTVSTTVVIRDTIVNNIHTTDTVYQVITKDSVIIREVEKIIHHTDTVKVTIVQHDTIVNEIEVVKYDTIVRNIIVHDTVTVTVYDRTAIYQDTVYLIGGFIRPTTSIPLELIPLLLEYGEQAEQHGKSSPGAEMIIQYMPESELPGEDWNSFGFDFSNQWVIYLNVNVPTEQQRAGIFRELTHLHLKKKYSNDVNKLMSPLWDPAREIKKVDLDNLFK